jgi:NADPH:quinone reductase
VKLLKELGAVHVLDSTSPTFAADLVEACVATKATIAFDAIGGGTLASQILTAMEHAANRTAKTYSRYGSATHKQVYIYGGLDRGPTELTRGYGMAWGVGGWLLTPFLSKVGLAKVVELRDQVAAGLSTVFASQYTAEVTLAGALQPDALGTYSRQATGHKYLVTPNA